MTPDQLRHQLDALLADWENECVEFKDANDNFSTSDIGKYFSALSNEANLRSREAGWLTFGVDNKTRKVIGTTYRENTERLHSLKHQIAQCTDPSVSFREIHELQTAEGRVVLFEITRRIGRKCAGITGGLKKKGNIDWDKDSWANVLEFLKSNVDKTAIGCLNLNNQLFSRLIGITEYRNETGHKPSSLQKKIDRDKQLRTRFESAMDELGCMIEAARPLRV